jgi:hypothetical protein
VLAGTAQARTVLAGTADEASFEHEYGPEWELLNTADARRR